MHDVQQIGSIAAIELNQKDRARTLLLRSVSLPGRKWARKNPDLRAAKRLLASGDREGVLQYFEAATQVEWGLGKEDLNRWIQELRLGHDPKLL